MCYDIIVIDYNTIKILYKERVSSMMETENDQLNMEKRTVPVLLDLSSLFKFNGDATQIDSNTAQLTTNAQSKAGALTGITGLNMMNDFSLDMDVNLGTNKNGADGVGIAFHQDSIGAIGKYGGGLGIRGLKAGIGFELDTFWEAPDDHDTSFNHTQMKGPHAGFIATDKSTDILVALASMQNISAPDGSFKNIKINWRASENVLTADYEEKHFVLNNPAIDKNVKYTFTIAASTGASYNAHIIRINAFDASFTKPKLTANDISVPKDSVFDPFDPKIGLKATDDKDGDITDKIRVAKNDVDTSKVGTYQVVYTVANSQGETDSATISVRVIAPTWPDGAPNGWQNFAGQDLELLKDPDNSLYGDFVFHSEQQAAIFKQFVGEEALKPGNYRVVVYAKGLTSSIPTLPLKVSLKKDSASGESRVLLLANPLGIGEKVEKGYYKVSADFTIASDETNPLITVENYQGGYIAGIFIDPIG